MSEKNIVKESHRIGAATAIGFSELKSCIEAILFASDSSLDIPEIRKILGEVSLADVKTALHDLAHDYEARAFFLYESQGKYQLRTRPQHTPLLQKLHQSKPRSLSRSALETLAIIAYKQPVTRAEINAIRSVDSSSIISTLKEKELIEVAGSRKEIGNPLEYKTTPQFLEIFGLDSLRNLPRLRSLQIDKREELKISEALDSLKNPNKEINQPQQSDLAFSSEQ